MKQDLLNQMVYSVCRKRTEIGLNKSCKNGSKYSPAHIKQVRDRSFIFHGENTSLSILLSEIKHIY